MGCGGQAFTLHKLMKTASGLFEARVFCYTDILSDVRKVLRGHQKDGVWMQNQRCLQHKRCNVFASPQIVARGLGPASATRFIANKSVVEGL